MPSILFSLILPGVKSESLFLAIQAACPSAIYHRQTVSPLLTSGPHAPGMFDPLIALWADIMEEGLHVVHGKSTLDLALSFPSNPVLTLIGDPVVKAVETFNHARKTPTHAVHTLAIAKGSSPARVFADPSARIFCNRQCRKLARLSDSAGIDPERLFTIAHKTLEERFPWIGLEGITRGPLPDLGALLREHGFESTIPVLESQPHKTPSLDPKALEAIRSANRADVLLWEYAQERMRKTQESPTLPAR